MPPTTPEAPWPLPELTRARRAIVVVDVVESVRLMQEDEAGFIDRWRRFVHEVRTEVLPKHGGRMVKSLGDGMLLEFEGAPQAVAAALAMQRSILSYNVGHTSEAAIQLRIGSHVADVVVDDVDLYGAGVNLAARLAALAQNGCIVVSSEVRDEVIEQLDCGLTDLGECYVKHMSTPVRAWRVGALPYGVASDVGAPPSTWQSTIAVLPIGLVGRGDSFDTRATQVLADDLARGLSANPALRVISQLSTLAVCARSMRAAEVGKALNARFLLTVRCTELGIRVLIVAELVEAKTEEILWTDSCREYRARIEDGDSERIAQWSRQVATTLTAQAAEHALNRPLPNVDSCSLLIGSIVGIHRTSLVQSDRAGAALQHLVERHPRAAEPHAWSAKWHMLKIAQRWSVVPAIDAAQARAHLKRAFDLQPGHALALAIDGHTRAYDEGQLQLAHTQLRAALAANPSESLAWLFLSNLLANQDRGDEALEAAAHANALAPVDPAMFLFDIFSAYAAIAAGDYLQARRLAERSVRLNASHLPSFPVLAIAQMLDGAPDAARETIEHYLTLSPDASIARYVERHRGTPRLRDLCATALKAAGLRN